MRQILIRKIERGVGHEALGQGLNELIAFEEFLKNYREEWRTRTICKLRIATSHCSNATDAQASKPRVQQAE